MDHFIGATERGDHASRMTRRILQARNLGDSGVNKDAGAGQTCYPP
jgi:hypothetical protein